MSFGQNEKKNKRRRKAFEKRNHFGSDAQFLGIQKVQQIFFLFFGQPLKRNPKREKNEERGNCKKKRKVTNRIKFT